MYKIHQIFLLCTFSCKDEIFIFLHNFCFSFYTAGILGFLTVAQYINNIKFVAVMSFLYY